MSTVTPGLVVATFTPAEESAYVNAVGTYSAAGVYYSQDAGATWLTPTIKDQNGQTLQSPTATALAATAVVWNPVRKRFYAAIRYHGYYESSDGINWTCLVNQPGPGLTTSLCPTNSTSLNCALFRGALAVQPLTGDMFAITTDINNLDQGVWQDACQPTLGICASSTVKFGTQLPSAALEAAPGDKHIPQADYDLWLAAVPVANDTLLFAGTEDISRCTVSSCAWRNITNTNTCAAARVAPSQHAVDTTFASTLGLIYFGNDGGLWRTTDSLALQPAPCTSDDAAHFQNLNGGLGSLAEVTDFASDPNDPATLLASFGAADTAATTSAQTAWTQVLGGEGSKVAIDPANPSNWYTATASGISIHTCNKGGDCNPASFGSTVIGSAQVAGDGNALATLGLTAPWILDPLDSSRVIVGTCRIWRGTAVSGAGWSTANLLSSFLDGVNEPYCNGNSVVRTLAATGTVSNLPGNQQLLYAGMAGTLDGGGAAAGHLYQAAVSAVSDATTHWTDISKSIVQNDQTNQGKFNPGAFNIGSIVIDPSDTTGHTVYVSIPGFSNKGISEPLLYSSTDGGAHWTNITGNIPAPVNAIVVDPNDSNTV